MRQSIRSFITAAFYCSSILLLCGCAHHGQAQDFADPYGFFAGIWHGLILPFSVLGFLFTSDVYIMGEPNTGLFYYVGFFVGFCILLQSGNDS